MKRLVAITGNRLATTAAALFLLASLSACELFIMAFTPCSNPYFGCAMEEVVSQPPHDNPLSRSLATPTATDKINDQLTKVVRAQYAALGNRWPANPSCQEIAAVGCSYLITLRYPRMRGIFCMDYLLSVEPGTGSGPVVRRKSPAGLIVTYDCEKQPRPVADLSAG